MAFTAGHEAAVRAATTIRNGLAEVNVDQRAPFDTVATGATGRRVTEWD